MSPKERAELDQALSTMADVMPSFLSRFYRNLCNEGFTPDAALYLTKEYLAAVASSRKNNDPPYGNKET